MTGHVQRWGNSLGLRIPKAVADELQLKANADVELELRDGALIVRPSRTPRFVLDDLLEQITPENLHKEVDWGASMGQEALE